jgi:tetratricopeptide (TPR) repeat protein
MGILDWLQTRHAEGIVHAEIALRLAEELDNITVRTTAMPSLANLEHALGNLDRAIALHLKTVHELEGQHEHSTLGRMILPSVRSRAFAAWMMAERGQFAEAHEQIAKGEKALAAIDQPYSRTLLNTAHGILLIWQRRPTDAIAPLKRALQLCHQEKYVLMEATAAAYLALALARTGAPEEARAVVLPSIESKRYMVGSKNSWVAVHQALAEAQFALGEKDDALVNIGKAVGFAETAREPLQIAIARFVRGSMLCKGGDAARARADLEFAQELARKHHMDPLAALCQAELAQIGPAENLALRL